MNNTSPTDTKEGDFCRLLRKVHAGCEPIDALIRDPLSRERLRVTNSAQRFLERQQDHEPRKRVYKHSTGKPAQT